ncbi:unnamed protein product [Microthlaspi erraticum]|uniref:Uncharacterized protein n=1 Tax=Microthlaspi erraticum TaxID=1685480 RepID=A0A6D2L690_9BRAS|nr:unnamed protein product [Microthlaspi erraticum]
MSRGSRLLLSRAHFLTVLTPIIIIDIFIITFYTSSSEATQSVHRSVSMPSSPIHLHLQLAPSQLARPLLLHEDRRCRWEIISTGEKSKLIFGPGGIIVVTFGDGVRNNIGCSCGGAKGSRSSGLKSRVDSIKHPAPRNLSEAIFECLRVIQ